MYAEGGDIAPRVLSVQASHCQGNVRYDSFSRNNQCTCVALTFLVNHSEGITFKMPDLDRVLKEGDAWYVGIKMQLIAEGRFNRNLLTMEEVPLSVSSFNRIHNVRKSGVMIGYLRATGNPGMEEWCIPLTERLQCLSTDVSHALLLVSPECIAVFRDRSGRYGFFDSHSRTAEGLPHPTGHGTAVMLTFTHLSDMADIILQIFWDRGDETSYEFMPVSFETAQQSVQLPSPSVCEQVSQLISALPKPATNVGAKENLVGSVAKNQDMVDKINKHRRRKEMRRTIDILKQHGGPKDTSPSNAMRKQDYDRNRYFQFQTNKIEVIKKKYNQDPHFRLKKKYFMARRYKINEVVQAKKREYMIRRYNTDALVQSKKKQYMMRRYNTDALVQSKKKQYIMRRYHTDALVQSKKKRYMIRRYHTDALVQSKKKQYMVSRYSTDTLFQSKMKQYMVKRFAGDPEFRAHHILRCTLRKTQKCVGDAAYHILLRLQCALRIKRKCKLYIRSSQQTPQPLVNNLMESAIHAFRCKIQYG